MQPADLATLTRDGPIIVFDALCVLCAVNARFVLRHDRRHHFRLASMQGLVGDALYRAHGIDPTQPETLIIVDGDRLLMNSDAVIAIWTGCGWPWRAAAVLRLVPHFIRDPIYRLVARNRYRWFGQRETCWLPAPADRDRVL
jgi:predicted DCC family thiol-disulfide oxidoreductase YuxK